MQPLQVPMSRPRRGFLPASSVVDAEIHESLAGPANSETLLRQNIQQRIASPIVLTNANDHVQPPNPPALKSISFGKTSPGLFSNQPRYAFETDDTGLQTPTFQPNQSLTSVTPGFPFPPQQVASQTFDSPIRPAVAPKNASNIDPLRRNFTTNQRANASLLSQESVDPQSPSLRRNLLLLISSLKSVDNLIIKGDLAGIPPHIATYKSTLMALARELGSSPEEATLNASLLLSILMANFIHPSFPSLYLKAPFTYEQVLQATGCEYISVSSIILKIASYFQFMGPSGVEVSVLLLSKQLEKFLAFEKFEPALLLIDLLILFSEKNQCEIANLNYYSQISSEIRQKHPPGIGYEARSQMAISKFEVYSTITSQFPNTTPFVHQRIFSPFIPYLNSTIPANLVPVLVVGPPSAFAVRKLAEKFSKFDAGNGVRNAFQQMKAAAVRKRSVSPTVISYGNPNYFSQNYVLKFNWTSSGKKFRFLVLTNTTIYLKKYKISKERIQNTGKKICKFSSLEPGGPGSHLRPLVQALPRRNGPKYRRGPRNAFHLPEVPDPPQRR